MHRTADCRGRRMLRNLRFGFVCAALLASGTGAAVNVAGIDRFGRAVMADGLLMEWKSGTAGFVSAPIPFRWDAVNTPQGLAGYLLFPDTLMLPSAIILNPVGGSAFRCDPRGNGEGIFGLAREGGSCCVEWVIPADSLRPDARGRYTVALALAPIGDSTGPVSILLTGSTKKAAASVGSIVSKGIVLQGGIVVLLGLVYFALVLRANRLKRARKKALHIGDDRPVI